MMENGNCEQTRYAPNPDGTLKLTNSQFDNATQTISSASANLSCNGAQCNLNFGPQQPAADYRIIDTDYTNYAVIYSCNTGNKREIIWIVTRAQNPKQQYVDSALAAVYKNVPGYTFDNFLRTY